jgi:hypothetical protein
MTMRRWKILAAYEAALAAYEREVGSPRHRGRAPRRGRALDRRA